ncbi:tetratricopeptide repeat protein [bacterium]|nr:tetratricopeptide repeat protein [bacterium]MCI0606345.1 tetratricopeptide repeat protein [bacterium]
MIDVPSGLHICSDTYESELEDVFKVIPNYPIGHQALPNGRFAEAISHLEIARQLDPLALWVNAQLGYALFVDRQYEEAVAQLQKTLELNDHFYLAHMFLGIVYS